MNLEELMASTPPMQQHALIKGFQAGAASRDAEVTKWIERVNSWTRDCERLADERDQLRAQINVLRAALTAKHIEICKKLAAENEGLAGEVWCERCADAIEKGGVL